MSKNKSSEQRARVVARELLSFRGWDINTIARGGQLLEESEYKSHTTLENLFKGKSKSGKGDGKPDFLLVNNSSGLKPILIIETKASAKQAQTAIDEATFYGDACYELGHNVIAVGIAGDQKEICSVIVKRKIDGYWRHLILNETPIDWIPSLQQVHVILSDPNRVNIEPERPSEEILTQQANRLNEIFRECKIKDEYRPVYAATFMLALWQADVSTDESVVLKQVNGNSQQALDKAKKTPLAQSLRVDEQNAELASRAWEIIDILKKLNIRSFLQEHDYLGQLYETFFRYTGGNTIGQYFTPRHIIAFMVEMLGIQPDDIIFDPACGTGGFLIGALNQMIKSTNLTYEESVDKVKSNLFGIESEPSTAALCVTNMIFRGDGKSGIIKDDCFKNKAYPNKLVDFVLMNPPFPHKKTDTHATKFIDRGLESLRKRGVIAAVVPYSLLVRVTEWHRTVLKNNNLLFIATLPPDLFSPYASYNTAIIFIEKGIPHSGKKTFVCRISNDGYKLKKNLRILHDGSQLKDIYTAYHSKLEIAEMTALADINVATKEWSPEAFIKNAPHQDGEFLIGLENHIRKHASFYVLYGHKLVDSKSLKQNHENIPTSIFSSLSKINISGVTYGDFSIKEYFDIKLGGKDEIEDLEEGDIPIVSTSEFNNGVTSFKKPNVIYNPPVITVATDGSTCSSFVQEFPFYAFYKVALLSPKKDILIPIDAMYYISYLLFREKWRYVYARKFGKARLELTNVIVPFDNNGKPDFSLMANIVQNCQAFCALKLYRKA